MIAAKIVNFLLKNVNIITNIEKKLIFKIDLV